MDRFSAGLVTDNIPVDGLLAVDALSRAKAELTAFAMPREIDERIAFAMPREIDERIAADMSREIASKAKNFNGFLRWVNSVECQDRDDDAVECQDRDDVDAVGRQDREDVDAVGRQDREDVDTVDPSFRRRLEASLKNRVLVAANKKGQGRKSFLISEYHFVLELHDLLEAGEQLTSAGLQVASRMPGPASDQSKAQRLRYWYDQAVAAFV